MEFTCHDEDFTYGDEDPGTDEENVNRHLINFMTLDWEELLSDMLPEDRDEL